MEQQGIRDQMAVHARGEGGMTGMGGVHVGTVDRVENGMIKLTKNDAPDGVHHYIPLSWVERIEGGAVILSKSADEVHRDWVVEA